DEKLRYKAYRVKTMSTEAQCTDILSGAKEKHRIRGVQYGEAMHICDLLVDTDVELDTQAFPMPMELLDNIYDDDHATGPVKASNGATGWKCWTRNSGTFFLAQKTLPCSGQQVDVLECPVKSCESCADVDCVFGEWSMWGAASCTQLCERHRVISTMNKCGGLACNGPLVMTKHCRKDCQHPEDCAFAGWTEWDLTGCTGEGGQKHRERVVAQVAVNEGRPCSGPTEETTACGGPTSDVDCEMGMWM
ncbi:HMCN1, partial [Symbiodinium pilosum]